MRVLVACEESGRVTAEFRRLGHEAYSCDILPTSGGHPEWHIQGDVLPLLNQKWDMIIAFPPCTYLTVTGNRWFSKKYGAKAEERKHKRKDAALFFMQFANADCPRIAIENPIGYMSTAYRKPDEIIQPYQFGHEERKATCLWLKGLPKLKPTHIVKPVIINHKSGRHDSRWHYETLGLPPLERATQRSKTFPGIARAMAEQWGSGDFYGQLTLF